jgi:DNA gyrase subunit A
VVPGVSLLVAGENGIGKRTEFTEYRCQSRGGKGIITMKTGEKTGLVVGALPVSDHDEVMLITARGQLVRIKCADIRIAGRNTMGVKLINLDEGDKLLDLAPVISQETDSEPDPGETPDDGHNPASGGPLDPAGDPPPSPEDNGSSGLNVGDDVEDFQV